MPTYIPAVTCVSDITTASAAITTKQLNSAK